jgi:hypothetical protein
MILSLQHYIDSDPILCAVHKGELSWDEAFTEEDEAALQHSILHGTRGRVIDDILELADEEHTCTALRVRWNMDVDVKEIPARETALPKAAPISVNPRNIKTLFVRNLPRDVTVAEMEEMFSPFGALHDVYVPKNTEPGKYHGTIKGFALIKYTHYNDSTRAFLDKGDTFYLRGKEVTVEFAKEDKH